MTTLDSGTGPLVPRAPLDAHPASGVEPSTAPKITDRNFMSGEATQLGVDSSTVFDILDESADEEPTEPSAAQRSTVPAQGLG